MLRFPGPLQRPGGRPAREAEIDRSGKGRSLCQAQSERRSRSASCADLESARRKDGVTAATLGEWRGALLAAGAEAFKTRPVAQLDEQGRRQKQVIAELAMENELLRERIRRMEDEKPSLRWRSRV
jgi:hypothetical protein